MKETRPVAKHLTECLNFKKGIKYNLIAFLSFQVETL
ncbi:Uncharacterised protein [Mycoplasmopsis gallinacea]|uniref:Uncharacterized protein n=1 Tax=Mycoplasmopsis gallinacea TaxID=29556 RepID=A0A449A2D8_9BACT|nr:Uncharacterised protein [Mycoplasmopsis gallinacea]